MKKSLFTFLIFVVVVLFSRTEATFDFLFLKDLPPSSPLIDIPVTTSERVNSIILLPTGEFDHMEAKTIIQRIASLPDPLLQKIENNGIKIQLFIGSLTDFPSTKHLRGKTPRGYTNSITWDDVPGIGGGTIILVKIGASNRGNGHGSINLELHELGHSVDQIVFHGIRMDPNFLEIWQEEVANLFQGEGYFLNYPEEYFAETFAMFYTDRNTKKILKEKAPKTYSILSKLY
ncbi:anthrax toxin lethal factor-related metalloendopeptidase [Fervidibacillus halotolerans]|uniref:Toxin n=1 Tax=Fervidibacillus halotolerans TaxID=2980027 RepID=A0A9E8RYX1_9BACI|nr:toxin [Fervidibacillus halotolerans]WAA13276.1 toxin [Fervidibacillus halotolerans]